jgi:hypothetical protein
MKMRDVGFGLGLAMLSIAATTPAARAAGPDPENRESSRNSLISSRSGLSLLGEISPRRQANESPTGQAPDGWSARPE